jgi:hypothetical protein
MQIPGEDKSGVPTKSVTMLGHFQNTASNVEDTEACKMESDGEAEEEGSDELSVER